MNGVIDHAYARSQEKACVGVASYKIYKSIKNHKHLFKAALVWNLDFDVRGRYVLKFDWGVREGR